MAKKQDLGDLFKKTEPGEIDLSALDDGLIRPTGVGLKEGEIHALESIGQALGDYFGSDPVKRNAVMRLAIRRFLREFLGGKITLEQLAREEFEVEKPKPRPKYK